MCPILLANEALRAVEAQDLCCLPISLGCQGYFLTVYPLHPMLVSASESPTFGRREGLNVETNVI